jgi:hypothetical protein
MYSNCTASGDYVVQEAYTPAVCQLNEYVLSDVCTACPAGWSNNTGNDATGTDTVCDNPCDPNPCESANECQEHVCTPGQTAGSVPGSAPTVGSYACSAVLVWKPNGVSCGAEDEF